MVGDLKTVTAEVDDGSGLEIGNVVFWSNFLTFFFVFTVDIDILDNN